MILGYTLVTAVLVVALGRLGDVFGRVRMYTVPAPAGRGDSAASRP